MKLVDALEILKQQAADDAQVFPVALACGFTPLHLETFLAAELQQALPDRRVEISTGSFDDLVGSVRRARDGEAEAVVAVIEWADIDARLGLRRLGGWRAEDVEDVVVSANKQLARLAAELSETADRVRVVCAFPTLPMPPVFVQGTYEAGPAELELRALVAGVARELAAHSAARVVGEQRLAAVSPLSSRHDPAAEISAGFPYTRDHASALADMLARLVLDPLPKKGLITDLDDTLWSGIVGEVGPADVSWSEASGAHAHALYQQFLASLASAGVLVGVASKNDIAVVDEVFGRPDILLAREAVFPFEVHWDAKSRSVGRILEAWNVGPDSVVLVDDSPMEIAQVQSVFPGLEGIAFPGGDYQTLLEFLGRLRDLFGKHVTNEEDVLRLDSIRRSRPARTTAAGEPQSLDEFLADARGEISFSCGREQDSRAFELINKTNQFNVNGRRLSERDFSRALSRPGGFLLTVAYKDKFGPLGKIAAVLGRAEGSTVTVDSWVMSCRAFSRRIEHQSLAFLFETFAASRVVVAYTPTERNGPLRQFLQATAGTDLGAGEVTLTREAFEGQAPALVHEVVESDNG
jgi:FkbH-like protein